MLGRYREDVEIEAKQDLRQKDNLVDARIGARRRGGEGGEGGGVRNERATGRSLKRRSVVGALRSPVPLYYCQSRYNRGPHSEPTITRS